MIYTRANKILQVFSSVITRFEIYNHWIRGKASNFQYIFSFFHSKKWIKSLFLIKSKTHFFQKVKKHEKMKNMSKFQKICRNFKKKSKTHFFRKLLEFNLYSLSTFSFSLSLQLIFGRVFVRYVFFSIEYFVSQKSYWSLCLMYHHKWPSISLSGEQ